MAFDTTIGRLNICQRPYSEKELEAIEFAKEYLALVEKGANHHDAVSLILVRRACDRAGLSRDNADRFFAFTQKNVAILKSIS